MQAVAAARRARRRVRHAVRGRQRSPSHSPAEVGAPHRARCVNTRAWLTSRPSRSTSPRSPKPLEPCWRGSGCDPEGAARCGGSDLVSHSHLQTERTRGAVFRRVEEALLPLSLRPRIVAAFKEKLEPYRGSEEHDPLPAIRARSRVAHRRHREASREGSRRPREGLADLPRITLRSRPRTRPQRYAETQRFLTTEARVTEIGAHAADPNASHVAALRSTRASARTSGTQDGDEPASCVPAVLGDDVCRRRRQCDTFSSVSLCPCGCLSGGCAHSDRQPP